MHNLFNVKLESTEILEVRFFVHIDSFLRKMLLESMKIPLALRLLRVPHKNFVKIEILQF